MHGQVGGHVGVGGCDGVIQGSRTTGQNPADKGNGHAARGWTHQKGVCTRGEGSKDIGMLMKVGQRMMRAQAHETY